MAETGCILPNRSALAAHLSDNVARQLVAKLEGVTSQAELEQRLSEALTARVSSIEGELADASSEVA
jgi:hypothetical protein